MIPVSKALEYIVRETPRLDNALVPIDHVVGRILAEDIVADMDLPPFDRSQMDGFAVRSQDVANAPIELKIVGESAAGRGWHQEMKCGEAVRIMTGAPVPAGADTVQKVELTSEHDFGSDSAQKSEGKITINESIAADKNIVRRGAEIKKGDRVLEAGEQINDRMIATLAAFGYANVSVAKRPRVSIFTTGSEVVEIDQTPGVDQIRNSNSAMLTALAEPVGGDVTLVSSAVDDLETIKASILSAAANSEIVVITGGVSVGKYDLTKTALIELGAQVFFDRVRLKPGKPAVFARLNQTLVFGLPGNPMSAAVTFYLFVRKALLLMQSAKATDLRRAKALSGGTFKAARERDTYFPAKLDIDVNGRVIVSPVKWIGSSDFIGFGRSNVLAFVPGSEKIESGDIAEVLLF